MRRTVLAILALALLLIACSACGKKGLPEECEQYLGRYDCFLTKAGLSDKQTTLDGIRATWTSASKTSAGRGAILKACQQQQTQMETKFKESGCANAATTR